MSKQAPFYELRDAVRAHPEYAWTLQCNLAVPIMDELRCTHLSANLAAARIMRLWFGIDITKNPCWAYLSAPETPLYRSQAEMPDVGYVYASTQAEADAKVSQSEKASEAK